MQTFNFLNLTKYPDRFFALLPEDWKQEILPFWDDYANAAQIYGIKTNTNLVGGGIVFYKNPPNFEYFETEANIWFEKGYYYLGFIWVSEAYRNKNLGSLWLSELKLMDPNQRYFLLTEEDQLRHFYERNGFKCFKSISHNNQEEWLFVYDVI